MHNNNKTGIRRQFAVKSNGMCKCIDSSLIVARLKEWTETHGSAKSITTRNLS